MGCCGSNSKKQTNNDDDEKYNNDNAVKTGLQDTKSLLIWGAAIILIAGFLIWMN